MVEGHGIDRIWILDTEPEVWDVQKDESGLGYVESGGNEDEDENEDITVIISAGLWKRMPFSLNVANAHTVIQLFSLWSLTSFK